MKPIKRPGETSEEYIERLNEYFDKVLMSDTYFDEVAQAAADRAFNTKIVLSLLAVLVIVSFLAMGA